MKHVDQEQGENPTRDQAPRKAAYPLPEAPARFSERTQSDLGRERSSDEVELLPPQPITGEAWVSAWWLILSLNPPALPLHICLQRRAGGIEKTNPCVDGEREVMRVGAPEHRWERKGHLPTLAGF